MKNVDAVIEPMNYLEILFGRYVNESLGLELEFRRVNYFCFLELVTGFTAIGAFEDLTQCEKAHAMCQRLQNILDLTFDE